MKTELEVIKELTKGKTLKHFTDFFVKFNEDGKLVYSHNKVSWGKRTGEVNFENPEQWQVEPEVIETVFSVYFVEKNNSYELGYKRHKDSWNEALAKFKDKRVKVRIEVLGDE